MGKQAQKYNKKSTAILFSIAYLFAAIMALLLTQGASGIAAIWPASGIALAGALLLQGRNLRILYGGLFVASMCANLTVDSSILTSVAFSVANLVEVWVARSLILKGFDASRHIANPRNIVVGAVAALAAAAISASTAAILSNNFVAPFLVSWAATVFFGMTTVAPALLFLFNDWTRLKKESVWQIVLVIGGVALASVAAFSYDHYPLLWLPMAATGYATYRLGLSGAATSLLILSLISTAYSAAGMNLPGINPYFGQQTLFLQIYLVGVLAAILPIAALLEDHRFIVKQLGEAKLEAERNSQLFKSAAETDALTGVANRAKTIADLDLAVARSDGQHAPLSVLMLDIDHFKAINDKYGHATGDRALSIVAERCALMSHAQGTFGRIGGEEFLLILPWCTAENARELALQIRSEIEAYDWAAQNLPQITLSIGVADLKPRMSASALLAEADLKMYEAKQLGRNQVRAAA